MVNCLICLCVILISGWKYICLDVNNCVCGIDVKFCKFELCLSCNKKVLSWLFKCWLSSIILFVM